MAVVVRGYEFRPGLVPSLAALVMLLILVGLGFWQLDRAEQKQQLLGQYERDPLDAPIRIDATLTDTAGLNYRPAQVRGVYDGAHQFLLDNRTHDGRVGYQVLTPLKIGGGERAILVNRGWVPAGATRSDLPELPAPDEALQVTGLLKLPPAKVFVLGEGEDRAPGWPKVLQQVRLELHAGQLGYSLLPVMLLLDADEPGGFVRDWRPFTFGPERNVGYAVQWFSLAAALVLIYVLVNIKKVSHEYEC